MKDVIICNIGKNKIPSIRSLELEYIKRMPWKIECKEIDCKKDYSSIAKLKTIEGKLLLAAAPANSFIVALDEKGKDLDSLQFASTINNFTAANQPVVFFIGGAFGHSEEVLAKANFTLSLSNLTFVHFLVRLILLEQLYRAYTIINKHPYHK